MILIIDNYDSFTYNLYQYVGEMNPHIEVIRNDRISLEQIGRLPVEQIIISPGPGYPCDAGISLDLIRTFADKVPILGVCLGHQCIAEAFGGRVVEARYPYHGKTSLIYHQEDGILAGLSSPFAGARYHSLLVEEQTLPSVLRVTSRTENGEIMSLEHKQLPVYGVQFHPESIISEQGRLLLANFLKKKGVKAVC